MDMNDIENIPLPQARTDTDNTGLLSDVIEILELDMFMNQNQSNCDGSNTIAATGAPLNVSIMDPQSLGTISGQQVQESLLQQQQQQLQSSQQTQSALQQQNHQQQSSVKSVRKKPYVKIVEQPASKGLRFRYECEGRSAGSIPGVNSTPDNKTFPTIEIVGYKGRAVVVVSCVTKDAPYRPHPHNLVGKEGCKKGVCTIEINSETMRAVFSNLGIQCVKKKDIAAALKAREEIRVDPFKTGSSYKNQTSNIDLNAVRLCFQVFLEGEQKGRFTQPIAPVVSDPIYDKKAMSDLVICRLCSCSSTVAGGATIILLCEKVSKDDISVRFYQEKNGKETWVAFGEFQQTDVHKQTAITFKTPRYHTMEIDKPDTVSIQLYRPSDGATSEPLPFDYVPLESGMRTFWAMRRNLKRKPDIDIFQQILSMNGETMTNMTSSQSDAIITLDTPTTTDGTEEEASNTNDSLSSPTEVPNHLDDTTDEATKRKNETEVDHIVDEKVRELQIEFSPQCGKKNDSQEQRYGSPSSVHYERTDENRLHENCLMASEPHQLSPNDKITEWMKSSEFGRIDSLATDPDESISSPTTCTASVENNPTKTNPDEDKALNDLLDQVAELDELYTDHQMRQDTFRNTIVNELNLIPDPLATETSMDIDESFDDAATYTSLQIAFKNPISIPMTDLMPPTPPASQLAPEDAHYDAVEVLANPPASISKVEISSAIIEPAPSPDEQIINITNSSNKLNIEEAQIPLPPLPPKRVRKLENVENCSIEANTNNKTDKMCVSKSTDVSRSPSQIIIMKTPDQSPPTKRLPPTPNNFNNNNSNNCNSTLPRQKKPGFFSKLFSRRKSKSDINQPESITKSTPSISTTPKTHKSSLPPGFHPPMVKPFPLKDAEAAILRPAKSMQPLTSPSPSTSASMKKSFNTVKDSAVLKRKRQKTGGDPMHFIKNINDLQQKNSQQSLQQQPQQQQQQQQQQNHHDHRDGLGGVLSKMSWNIPAIKTEPRDASPQSFGLIRAMSDHATPSPQPPSPSNPYSSGNGTPSPYNITMGGGGGALLTSNNNTVTLQNFGGFQEQQIQSSQFQANITNMNSFLPDGNNILPQWNSPSPSTGIDMQQITSRFQSNNLGQNPFSSNNLSSSVGTVIGIVGSTNQSTMPQSNHQHLSNQDWNMSLSDTRGTSSQTGLDAQQLLHQLLLNTQQEEMACNQLQPSAPTANHIQQHHPHTLQQTTTNEMSCTETVPSVSNLFNLDSDQLMSININSEDLQISNLSIST